MEPSDVTQTGVNRIGPDQHVLDLYTQYLVTAIYEFLFRLLRLVVYTTNSSLTTSKLTMCYKYVVDWPNGVDMFSLNKGTFHTGAFTLRDHHLR